MTRDERKAAAKARKEAAKARLAGPAASDDDDEEEEEEERKPAKAAPKKTIAVSNPNDPANAAAGGLSRREREALEAAAAKERYWKLQEAGKTDQAKADMARLAKIREDREEKAKQRKAGMLPCFLCGEDHLLTDSQNKRRRRRKPRPRRTPRAAGEDKGFLSFYKIAECVRLRLSMGPYMCYELRCTRTLLNMVILLMVGTCRCL